MALATAAQVREMASGFTSADDSAIGVQITRAGSVFARHCRMPKPDSGAPTLEAAAYTVYPNRYDIGIGDDVRTAVLHTPPIISITSVHIDPEQDYGSSTLVSSSDYVADRRRVELLESATDAWSRAPRANKVVVSAGYVVADEPELTHACIIQVIHWLGNAGQAGSSSTSTRGGGSRSVSPLGLLPEVVEMLADYQQRVP